MIKGHILEQEGDNRINASCIMDMHYHNFYVSIFD